VEYKQCTVLSQPASLSILDDEEIVRGLLGECGEAGETEADAAVGRFLEKYGNSSRLGKKALVAVLQSESELPALLHSLTSRQVPVNFHHNGMSPLHYACVKGHWRAVQHLLACGASKAAVTQEGRNAVHLVSIRGDNNSLQFLIHTGAEQLVNVQDKYGKAPLHLVCEAAKKITPSKTISQDMRDMKTVIQNLLKLKASLRRPDESGQTPLHLAVRAGHPWVVEAFLLCDTSGLDEKDRNGDTCLHIATAMAWSVVVISLLEREADETIENKDHMTPLALAEAKGHTDVANILQRKPGTVQRNRKQTVYVTANAGRPLSAHVDAPASSSPTAREGTRSRHLLKSSSEDQQENRRSWSHLPGSPVFSDGASKFLNSGLLKLLHITSPPAHNGHEPLH
jgi:ankyrin repeat protein